MNRHSWKLSPWLPLTLGVLGLVGCQTVQSQVAPNLASQPKTLVATDEAIASAQKEAISAASKDARSQAEAALGALELKQQEIVSIQINGAPPPMPLASEAYNSPMDQTMAPEAVPSTPVVAGDQRVEAFVTLQVRYQPQ